MQISEFLNTDTCILNTDIWISIRDICIYGCNRDGSVTSLTGFYIRTDQRLQIPICALTDVKKKKKKKSLIKDAQDFTSSSLYSKTHLSFQKAHNNILPCLILCSHFRPSLFFYYYSFFVFKIILTKRFFFFLILKSYIDRNTCLCPLHVRTKDTFAAAIIDLFFFIFALWQFTRETSLYQYENTPIQIYWKFHHQQLKIFK